MTSLTTELLPHQQRVVDRLTNKPGLVVAHGLGSGKTLAAIAAADANKGSTKVLVPASLIDNFHKEIMKHTSGLSNTDVSSLQREILQPEHGATDLLIVDEAHRAREPATKAYDTLFNYPATKRLLLSATPVYNRPSDIASLINIAAQDKVLPEGRAFENRYVSKEDRGLLRALFGRVNKPHLKNVTELKKAMNEWVDYHQVGGKDFPSKSEEVVDVEMSPKQTALHALAWDKLPFTSRIRLKAGMPPNKQELSKLNKFQSQTRQIGGSTNKFVKDEDQAVSPKLQRAFEDLQKRLATDEKHKALVYSNFLDTINDYATLLQDKKIPYAQYTGNVSQKERTKILDDYNLGRIKALLVSSAGGEGLDLKGTRQVQVLEPHWNEEKLDQVIGRAIRRESHKDLPEAQRHVDIQRYVAHPQASFLGKIFGSKPMGVEQLLYNISKDKKDLNNQLLQLLEKHNPN
jgi:SNF2 family DNA or RNA helicase